MRRGENIYKRRDGRWEGRYIASRDARGKAFYRSVYAHTYHEVREKLKSFSERSRSGRSAAFEEVANSWLAGVKLRCKLSTYNKYLNTYQNHLLPEFWGHLISEISSKQVEAMISSKTKYSEKTRTDILSILKQILKHARHSGLQVDTTIADLSVHRTKKEIRVLTGEEQKSLEIQLIKDNALIPAGIYLALYTGLRIGELCALKRSGIDLKTGIIHVSGTMQRLRVEASANKTQVMITAPKSRCSVRDIPIPNKVLIVCREFYDNLPENSFLLTGNNSYIEPRLLSYHFKKHTDSCGLEGVHFHTLRHTYATRCIECGIDVKTLSEILGHYDVSVTLNRYVHSSMELKRKSVEKLCR